MIANARMYSVSPEAAELWRSLLSAAAAASPLQVTLLEHPEPAPMSSLWSRNDMAAVFMCGLPFSRAVPRPLLLAAPVPSPSEYGDKPQYWSEFVVRADGLYRSISDTFGGRLALTVPDSQSGYAAALTFLMNIDGPFPRYAELVAPSITPLGALTAVIAGAADVAPIDSYAFALLQRFRPDLTGQVRSVARTPATPIPPLVASHAAAARMQPALLEAHETASIKLLMDALLVKRFIRPDRRAYDALRESHSAAQTYWTAHALATVIHPAFVL